ITKYTFEIQDIQKPDCSRQFGLDGPVCCTEDCYIREVVIEELCDNANLSAYVIDFDHNMDTNTVFALWTNGVKVGNYHISQLPLTIDNITFQTQTVVFKIVNLTDETCRKELSYTFECHVEENSNTCQLDVSGFDVGECNDAGEFYVFFTLKAENHGNQGFSVFINNSLASQNFEYGQNSYKLGPLKGDCMTKYHFLIK